MAVHTFESSLHFSDFTAEPADHPRTVSEIGPDGSPITNLGAFRGLAFALIFETVFVILASLAWQVWRTFAH